MSDVASPAPPSVTGREAARTVGPIGVWSAQFSAVDASTARRAVRDLEQTGIDSLWISEGSTSKEVFSHAAVLLASSERIVIGTGIANIYARDAQAMANGERTLGDAFPGRFVLGLGVSHAPRVEQRGGTWGSPLATMTAYLEAMDAASCAAPAPSIPVPRVIGALGPRMSELSARRTAGVLPYFVPVDHVRVTRESLGPEPLIAVEQMVLLEEDADRARARARAHARNYLELENYRRNLRRFGLDDSDLDDGGSDRLIDDIIVWGGRTPILERIDTLREAGADHVCIQVLDEDLLDLPRLVAGILGG